MFFLKISKGKSSGRILIFKNLAKSNKFSLFEWNTFSIFKLNKF